MYFFLGIDYYHPALGGGFGPGFKVVAGYDFVGDDWNSNDPNSKLEPDNDPLDNCSEEGSIGTGKNQMFSTFFLFLILTNQI